jgi:aarF domain-containing kinase
MSVNVGELLAAMPRDAERDDALVTPELQQLMEKLAHRPVPIGTLRRLWSLGGLHTQVGGAYFFWWVRSWFGDADANKRRLLETHLRAAYRVLGTMSYLRGIIMKLGQTAANYPGVAPEEIIDTLSKLHFEAPPMHFTLLREHFRNELGKDPEDIFAEFETHAFAAASLGQVHRARLKTGERVAVKIQYPGIARTIKTDFRNLQAVFLPLRFTRDWENLKAQFDDLVRVVERETDYEAEARWMTKIRALFSEDDGIVVPRPYEQYSTPRVLTMDYIEGQHVDQFLAANPAQEIRDLIGERLNLAEFRMEFAGALYSDAHPGNYLFMPDGRVGLIDFGSMRPYSEDELEYINKVVRALYGTPEQKDDMLRAAMMAAPGEYIEPERMAMAREFYEWTVKPLKTDGPFDYRTETEFKRSVDLLGAMISRRYTRAMPMHQFVLRMTLGLRAMLLRLGSRVDLRKLYEREMSNRGWQKP